MIIIADLKNGKGILCVPLDDIFNSISDRITKAIQLTEKKELMNRIVCDR